MRTTRVVTAKARRVHLHRRAIPDLTVRLDPSQIMGRTNLVANRMEMKTMTTVKVPKAAKAQNHPKVIIHRHPIEVSTVIIRRVVPKIMKYPQIMVWTWIRRRTQLPVKWQVTRKARIGRASVIRTRVNLVGVEVNRVQMMKRREIMHKQQRQNLNRTAGVKVVLMM